MSDYLSSAHLCVQLQCHVPKIWGTYTIVRGRIQRCFPGIVCSLPSLLWPFTRVCVHKVDVLPLTHTSNGCQRATTCKGLNNQSITTKVADCNVCLSERKSACNKTHHHEHALVCGSTRMVASYLSWCAACHVPWQFQSMTKVKKMCRRPYCVSNQLNIL